MPKKKSSCYLKIRALRVSVLAINKEVESWSFPISGDKISTKKVVISISRHRCIWVQFCSLPRTPGYIQPRDRMKPF